MAILTKRQWQGNIRELKKTIKLIISRYPDISDILYRHPYANSYKLQGSSLSERVNSFEKNEIEVAFIKNNRNVTKTAQELGFKRTTLISKIEKYGLKELQVQYLGDICSQLSTDLKTKALEQDLLIYPGYGTIDGQHGNHVLFAPPFVTSKSDIEEIVLRFDRVLSNMDII